MGNIIGEIDNEITESHYNYDFGYKWSERAGKTGRGFLSQGMKILYHHSNNYSDNQDELEPFIFVGGNYEGDLPSELLLEEKNGEKFTSKIIEFELDKDYIFEEELKRLEYKEELHEDVNSEKVAISPDGTMIVMLSRDYNLSPSHPYGGYLIYLNENKPNIEFKVSNFGPYKFTWLSNRYIVYDVWKSGIYVYDVDKDQNIRINYNHMGKLGSVEDGNIFYNYEEGTAVIQGTMTYSFDSEGNLLIDGNRVGQNQE